MAWTLGAPAYSGRTERRAWRRLGLGHLHRGGAGKRLAAGPGARRPTEAQHSWPGPGRERAGVGVREGGRKSNGTGSEGAQGGKGCGEGGEGWRDAGLRQLPGKPLVAAATSTSLYIRKITAAAPADATNGGAG